MVVWVYTVCIHICTYICVCLCVYTYKIYTKSKDRGENGKNLHFLLEIHNIRFFLLYILLLLFQQIWLCNMIFFEKSLLWFFFFLDYGLLISWWVCLSLSEVLRSTNRLLKFLILAPVCSFIIGNFYLESLKILFRSVCIYTHTLSYVYRHTNRIYLKINVKNNIFQMCL